MFTGTLPDVLNLANDGLKCTLYNVEAGTGLVKDQNCFKDCSLISKW